MNVDEDLADLPERRDGHGLIVDVGSASASAVQPPRQDDLIVLAWRIENAFDGLPDRRMPQFKEAGDAQFVAAGPNQVRRAAIAEQQADRPEQQRLARAGLARSRRRSPKQVRRARLRSRQIVD